ncbi:MAG: M61 family metallopeptidase [Cyclobacteriaceae bacterium]
MEYYISFENPLTHFINIRLVLTGLTSDLTVLEIPLWRPGRYELANYAKNIQKITVVTPRGKPVPFKKISTSRWEVATKDTETLEVHYNYYAHQLDAGASWLDEDQLYLNFINCMVYYKEQMNRPCQVHLDLPNGYQIGCSLPTDDHRSLKAENYYQLVDSPMIASDKLEHLSYEVAGTTFHLWVMGDNNLNWQSIVPSFEAFSHLQYETMKEFPFDTYHFLYQTPVDKKYHGVEHASSTVIALGPGSEMDTQKMKESLLGVSSHELFHAWNVIGIRPKEMMPYDFSRENYFSTGFVAEGVTTYYGDLFLVRSGVFNRNQYFKELDTLCKRHFENYGRFNHSLVQSSYDLWLDGYDPGIPNRKVSIYTKGALVALILDLLIKRCTDHRQSLDDLMNLLWKEYGKPGVGYSLEDYKSAAEKIAGSSLDSYFKKCINGTDPLEAILDDLLPEVGCGLQVTPNDQKTKSLFGFATISRKGVTIIQSIAPDSPAEAVLSIDDQILTINGSKVDKEINAFIPEKRIEIDLIRNGKPTKVVTESNQENYFPQIRIRQKPKATTKQKERFEQWLKCNW